MHIYTYEKDEKAKVFPARFKPDIAPKQMSNAPTGIID